MDRRLDVFVDYQNAHMTGHQLWCRFEQPLHECLIDPLALAQLFEQMFGLIGQRVCLVSGVS